ncbi:YhjD/YihY/BrkB family envelope integrity protein [Actinacidiphila acidipaludis]|uniref:YhjD/YihY/BrkB family envelope integrity protein n=1 Tax=Actinacidiphila acidipaludis TaxID=2873382 RepID=UPI003FD8E459
MDWLTRLPWIGPRVAALMRTHAWRAFAHLQTAHWTRLAAAMTFTSFLSLFPLLALTAAIGAALLSPHQLHTLESRISQQIPGISGQLDINGLVANAGTVGVIAGALLLLTGIGWVGSLRDCLRAVWDRDNDERNPVVGKLLDGGILLGLGVAVLVSLGSSGFATAAVNWTADKAGISHEGPGPALLTGIGFVLAVVADFLILVYLLTLLPGVEPPRRSVVVAGLIGAIGFELLKILLSGYLQGVAGKSMYGAFGTPVALLLWFNFMAKLLLYCAAWTATPVHAPAEDADDEDAGAEPADEGVHVPAETDRRVATAVVGVGTVSGKGAGGLPGAVPGPVPESVPESVAESVPGSVPGPVSGSVPGSAPGAAIAPDTAGVSAGDGNRRAGGAHRWEPRTAEPRKEAGGGAARQ